MCTDTFISLKFQNPSILLSLYNVVQRGGGGCQDGTQDGNGQEADIPWLRRIDKA